MKAFLRAAAVLMAALSAVCASAQSAQERYIEKYAATAVSEMYRTGVPASITLAQGLLESRYGQSALAAEGNNHFGIKCHDWKGKKQYADDETHGECFRKYDSAEESFRDHSDFLRYRDRYKFLFDYKTTDYKSWAYGLKKAGYATDGAYPSKLIKLIEEYNLARFDKMTAAQAAKMAGVSSRGGDETVAAGAAGQVSQAGKKEEKMTRAEKNAARAAAKETAAKEASAKKAATKKSHRKAAGEKSSGSGNAAMEVYTAIPESPLSLEEPVKLDGSESFTFSLSRKMYSLNGVPFIYAAEGETIESIAKSNNLFPKELRRFNDMRSGQQPRPGDIVYLQSKKRQAARGLDKYISDEGGESLRELSQRFAVRLSDLAERNSLSSDYVLGQDDEILLR